ncbi:hypothetical protein HKX48_009179 [Thoreauomyces humboldtii]|nr:hypothetical protein HKX48_009179 [Thoreauomyces humboldtii]
MASAPTSSQKAFVTAITRDSYIPGLQALARSLAKTGTPYPLYVLVATETIGSGTWDILGKETNVILKAVQRFDPGTRSKVKYAAEHFAEAWIKLRCWELDAEGVSLACWLDADMVIAKSIDHVLEDAFLPPDQILASSAACLCNPRKIPSYPDHWIPENCRHSYPFDPSPTGTKGIRYFNTGFFVFRPSTVYFDELSSVLAKDSDLTRFLFPEQDFLNEVIAQDRWVLTPYVYNALKTLPSVHPDRWRWSDVCILHYILDKPWNEAEPSSLDPPSSDQAESGLERLNRIWWKAHKGLDFSTDLHD